MLGALHKKDSVEKKWKSLITVSLIKALNWISQPLCAREVADSTHSLLAMVAQFDQRHSNSLCSTSQPHKGWEIPLSALEIVCKSFCKL